MCYGHVHVAEWGRSGSDARAPSAASASGSAIVHRKRSCRCACTRSASASRMTRSAVWPPSRPPVTPPFHIPLCPLSEVLVCRLDQNWHTLKFSGFWWEGGTRKCMSKVWLTDAANIIILISRNFKNRTNSLSFSCFTLENLQKIFKI